ncbi:hypothetical protein CL635_02305 [bacterium]|jgi:hypothetical protein|nr:hypothetical protein [bacterium]|tara:strand:- start:1967 stop:2221 length:255 start_codon:yes stop_codon:yes gene_type:complete
MDLNGLPPLDDEMTPQEEALMDRLIDLIPDIGRPNFGDMKSILDGIPDLELQSGIREAMSMTLEILDVRGEGWGAELDDSYRYN